MSVGMSELVDDLLAETAVLERVLDPLDDAGWATPTPAPGWRIHDQVTHLAYFDERTTLAARDPDAFRRDIDAALGDATAMIEAVRNEHAARPAAEALAWLRAARAELVTTFGALDPSTRVPWYGPEMSAASSLTARIMETWAHGQDVFDALGVAHPPTRALRQVAHLGARTLPNSFRARGLPVPDVAVRITLHAPDSSVWTWGDEHAHDRVDGDATQFCLVTTQRRNVADTELRVVGPVATQWMQIAQTFAGPPGAGRAATKAGP
jgi:uncharacterized protein (TIGR03084 family)